MAETVSIARCCAILKLHHDTNVVVECVRQCGTTGDRARIGPIDGTIAIVVRLARYVQQYSGMATHTKKNSGNARMAGVVQRGGSTPSVAATDTDTKEGIMIAQTIVEQLGGIGKLRAMVSAHTLIDHGDALSFKFKGSSAANYCKITLDPSDTYTVEFGRIRGLDYYPDAPIPGVYADQLVRLFTATTGLDLTL